MDFKWLILFVYIWVIIILPYFLIGQFTTLQILTFMSYILLHREYFKKLSQQFGDLYY